MAQKNRTEVKTELTNDITATVTIAKLNGVLIGDLSESAVFRKDVLTTGTGLGAQSISYLDIDQHEFTATGNVTFSFTDLNIGDRVKLVVIKSSAYTVGFSGTINENLGQTVGLTSVSYEIYYDNSGIIVTQMNRQTSGSLGIGAFTDSSSTQVDSVEYCEWNINNNIFHLEAYIKVQAKTTTAQLQFDMTLPHLPKNDQQVIKVGKYVTGSENIVGGYYQGSTDLVQIYLATNPTVTDSFWIVFGLDYIVA